MLIWISDDCDGKKQVCQLATDKPGDKAAALALMADVCKAMSEGADGFEVRNKLVKEHLALHPQPKRTRRPRKPRKPREPKGEALDANLEAPKQARKRPAADNPSRAAKGCKVGTPLAQPGPAPSLAQLGPALSLAQPGPAPSLAQPVPPSLAQPAPPTPLNFRRVVKSMMTLPGL